MIPEYVTTSRRYGFRKAAQFRERQRLVTGRDDKLARFVHTQKFAVRWARGR